MNFKPAIALFSGLFLNGLLFGQTETYVVEKAFFSTDKYDEFSPVAYKNGIVYCSNRSATRVMGYSTEDGKGFFKLYFADTVPGSLQGPKFLSKKLNSKFNDGPATFNGRGDTIFFSRNLINDGKFSEISSTRNKLGIFYAVDDGSEWSKIREMRINNEWYNVTTPCLSPDGKRLYFASDKPGGYGGSDLYYCQWRNDYWEDPVNLGPVINTKGNESYPFMNAAGDFFFSSDGHPGLGGKDIFFSRYADTAWIAPICLDAPVNSQYDDFGIFTDTLVDKGFFSSNRDKSLDIFEFRTIFPQIFYSSRQKENNYCFMFSDSGTIAVDTVNLQYKWSFGDGKTANGAVAGHCYSGPGNYKVRLDIVERSSGRLFFNKLMYDLELRDYIQAYITSPDLAVKGEEVKLDGIHSYLPGFKVLSYSWDFGDKHRAKGEKVSHTFAAKGEYEVNLELALRSDSTGQIRKTGITKTIRIFDNKQESAAFAGQGGGEKKVFPDVKRSSNATIMTSYSSESEFRSDAVFRVELLNSKTKLDLGGAQFRNIPSAFGVKESFSVSEGTYSYTVEQHLNLMPAYPAWSKMVSLGFKDAKVKMVVLTDAAEKELVTLIRINGSYLDSYFDYADRLTSNAFIMLDQIVKFMNKYPKIRLEVGVHSDNTGSADLNQSMTQKRAQLMADYLTSRGVTARRLVPVGYGSSKPVASNVLEKDRKLNRRIDFAIISR
jgi:flagellar motor protein MotB